MSNILRWLRGGSMRTHEGDVVARSADDTDHREPERRIPHITDDEDEKLRDLYKRVERLREMRKR